MLDVLRGDPEECKAKARCLRCHLTWEERRLFPALLDKGETGAVERWLDQHDRWRRLEANGQRVPIDELEQHAREEEMICERYPDLVVELGELCNDHLRIEREAAAE